MWGEHEIDYVLFAKNDVDLDVNKNEISEVSMNGTSSIGKN